MATRMLQRRGTAAEWQAANPVLAAGELGFETDTDILKVGDGVRDWLSLPTNSGLQGPTGPAGPEGSAGPAGPPGESVVVWTGTQAEYDALTVDQKNDAMRLHVIPKTA